MTRITHTQKRILDLISRQAPPDRQLSYDELAICIGVDRRTIITAVLGLEHHRRLRVERGRGGVANRYEVVSEA